MKRAIFNFFILQLIVWSVVFYDGATDNDTINYSSISDTWKVINPVHGNRESIILDEFHQLTLKEDGSFQRVSGDELQSGNWYLNKERSKLTLMSSKGVWEYDIIQLPIQSSETFIIEESVAEATTKYELNRL